MVIGSRLFARTLRQTVPDTCYFLLRLFGLSQDGSFEELEEFEDREEGKSKSLAQGGNFLEKAVKCVVRLTGVRVTPRETAKGEATASV